MQTTKLGFLALLIGGMATQSLACDTGLGLNADLHGNRFFPADNAWNQPIDTKPIDPNSTVLINQMGSGVALHPDFGANAYWADGKPFGIPYVVVSGTTPKVPVSFTYSSESDPGPYPIPANAPIESGSDRHVLVVDQDHWKLYETWNSYPQANGSWDVGSGAIFDLSSNALRPAGWTSADAAGLPILPGLVRYDEVYLHKAINHAIRFTVAQTRKAYIAPARHFASSNTSTNLLPMGARLRLKASYDISQFSPPAQVILKALKKYGMMVADNGSNMYISGTADDRWDDNILNTLKQVHNTDFEVVKMGAMTTK
ncbi:hypothetical protein [Methylovulum psychrotolerans]|uniref:Uncharacterized protein n=1 Tax=Methylovulum psychrotolerans TaxID=1704499 RepID=A0A2S5CLQ6_9GAMM|nr:hypothetical protein [Methylovulum psychrotolerans]POZ51749.1 hypothetical protein AADEFJLK_02623 [Methylovulum psychrotolerans]